MAAVAMALLWACSSKDDSEPETPPQQEQQTELRLALTAKYIYQGPSWNLSKSVRYYSGPGVGSVLTYGTDGRYANGTIKETANASHTVVSPDIQANYNGSYIAFSFPDKQKAQAGIVPNDIAFSLGTGTGRSVIMQPLFSCLLLNFARDDVKSVTLKTADGEYIHSRVRFYTSDLHAEGLDTRREISMEAAQGGLEAGKDWVMVLPPVSLEKGFTLTVVTAEKSYDFVYENALKLGIGEFLRITVPDEKEKPETPGTGLRTLIINTPGGRSISSKDNWTENCSVMLVDDKGKIYYENSEVAVKGRGNSTWNYPKKPYTLKLPSKADLIGTGEDKRWVLLANWMDRTLLRNDVAFEIARRTRLSWTPSGEFVEVYLNGKHIGNYWLGEKIKTGKSRLTADYLIEMDTYYDASWRFYSSYGRRYNDNKTGMPIGVKEPDDDEMTDAQFQTLKTLVNDAEKALYTGGDWKSKMNMESFIDWYLVHELTENAEPNHPKSCYFHFRDGVMYAGPVWDFDWYTFQQNITWLVIPKSIYYEQFIKDATFKAALKARWKELKPLVSNIPDYIDAKANEIRASEKLNWAMWPCTSSGVNGDEWLSFDSAISRMKTAFRNRLTAMDTAISAL